MCRYVSGLGLVLGEVQSERSVESNRAAGLKGCVDRGIERQRRGGGAEWSAEFESVGPEANRGKWS